MLFFPDSLSRLCSPEELYNNIPAQFSYRMTTIFNLKKLQKDNFSISIKPSQAEHFQKIQEISPTNVEEDTSIHLIQKIFWQWPCSSQATYHSPAMKKRKKNSFMKLEEYHNPAAPYSTSQMEPNHNNTTEKG